MSTVNVRVKCLTCGHHIVIEGVNQEGFEKWQSGQGHIQHLLPELSASERELLISQTCSPCFDKLFREEH